MIVAIGLLVSALLLALLLGHEIGRRKVRWAYFKGHHDGVTELAQALDRKLAPMGLSLNALLHTASVQERAKETAPWN